MKRIVQTTLAASIALALTACHNHGSTTPEEPAPEPAPPVPTTLTLKGAAVKGTLMGATVELFMADNLDTAIGDPVQTAADGTYELSYTDISGEQIVGAFVVKVTADDDTTMTCDAADTCNGVDRGQPIPATDLVGLSLSSFTFADNEATEVAEVNVNSLSTMATDAIISSAGVDGSAIDLSNVDADGAYHLQVAGSEVVGALIGVDLASYNLFSASIVDASVGTDISTTDSIAATLTLMNGALSNIDIEAESTFGAALSEYITTVNTIITATLEQKDLGAHFSEEMAALNLVQAATVIEGEAILTEVNLDLPADAKVEVEEVSDTIDPDEVTKIIGEVEVGTGATGGTGT